MNAHVSQDDASRRLAQFDWDAITAALDAQGWALMPALLQPHTCEGVAGLYGEDARFRSRVVMSKHGFGRGEYRYFAYPLPDPVAALRRALYSHLAPLAAFIQRCHDAGQTRPTPLLLQYGAGDYNCLHQDLYGAQVFPLQVAILLSEPGEDFEGGEFVLTEQRPRMQSRVAVVPLKKGDAVVFAVNHRPAQGARGPYRVNMRHGVSQIRAGRRHTLGIIFHDAV
jgi:hypothetical protein